ncbi:hypothetical protein [Myceligenerans crystallogenes]|uniref:Uncharacterized protein n=1 Tax=Myceligenerans crystallogenes TaxID=316335 RepID=A0ABN2NI59_9MICO
MRPDNWARVYATPVEAAAWAAPLDAVPLDDDGEPLDYPADFSEVGLENPNDEGADVRTVAIIGDNPESGQTRQAPEMIELSNLVTVPNGGKIVLDVEPFTQEVISEYAHTNAVSLKAYYSL